MLEEVLRRIKKLIPPKLFNALAPIYHYKLALLAALIYRFPAKRIRVIAVTGTKGKSSTTELISSIFEAAGHKTALLNTIRFKIGEDSTPNRRKMTVPGRFFLQKMLRRAVDAHCDTVVIELSSEAAKQFRHKFVYLDALVFLNLAPEHIESHGSYEKYRAAKVSFVRNLKQNGKLIVNGEDRESPFFLNATNKEKFKFTLLDAAGFKTNLIGEFNQKNIAAAVVCARAFGVSEEKIKLGIAKVSEIKGRVEFVRAGQNFDVVVDYAHTKESLAELYKAFEKQRKICVLGNTGGGRDKWKRPEMAGVADNFCDIAILTNEDPYDEDPMQIINEMLPGFTKHKPKIILDRREAIRTAISEAKTGDAVLITGKGTDPYIMEANGKKTPWSDSEAAREELEKVLS